MFRAGTLLCIVAFGVSFSTAQNHLPPLMYSCDPKGTITILNATQYKSIVVISGTRNPSENDTKKICNGFSSSTHLDTVAIEGCKVDTKVTVMLMSFGNDGRSDFILGGKDSATYDLECATDFSVLTPTPFTVVVTAASRAISGNAAPTFDPKIPIGFITMNINQTSAISVGDHLSLTVESTIGNKLAFLAKDCNAYNPLNKSEQIQLIHDGTAINNLLMDDFKPVANEAKMTSLIHAFHFKTGNEVTFNCSIYICKDTSVSECTGNHTAGMSGRRRRDTDGKLQVLQSTIIVHDRLWETKFEEKSTGYAQRVSHWLSVVLAVLWHISYSA